MKCSFLSVIGSALLKRFKDAVTELEKQRIAFNELTEAVAPEIICEWQDLVERWQADHSVKPDPYMEAVQSKFHFSFLPGIGVTTSIGDKKTMNDIKEHLAKMEAEEVRKGAAVMHELSPSAFLLRGLELEEVQYVILC